MGSLERSFHSLLFGLSLPLRAAKLILTHPLLAAASALPLLLSIGLDLWIIRRMQAGLAAWIHAHAAGALEWAALFLAWIALFIAGVLLFSFIAGIAALPFNDWLAELTEARTTPPLPPAQSYSWMGRIRLLLVDLLKTLGAMGLSLVALFLSWTPGLNLVGLGLAFLLIAFQFVSFPQTRRGEGFGAGIRFVFRHFWACLGFGMSFAFLFALPVVSNLALPLAVVGGTMLYARAVQSQRGSIQQDVKLAGSDSE